MHSANDQLNIEKSERTFHLDSERFIQFLNSTNIENNSGFPLLAAAKNVDDLFIHLWI